MCCPAAAPALLILAGVTIGRSDPALAGGPIVVAGILTWACSLAALGALAGRLFIATSGIGFLLAGTLLGANAARAATETTLWQWYQAEFTEGRSGRTVVVEGRLIKDATLTDYGASLSIAAAQLHASGVTVAVTGGIRAAVGGQFVDDRIGTWTQHRRVRIPLTLRPAARYDNPGVPNQQRTSMWRGTSLLARIS